MTTEQRILLTLQAMLAGLQVLNIGLMALGTYKLAALVGSSIFAACQFYVTRAANKTQPIASCRRCGAMMGPCEEGE